MKLVLLCNIFSLHKDDVRGTIYGLFCHCSVNATYTQTKQANVYGHDIKYSRKSLNKKVQQFSFDSL